MDIKLFLKENADTICVQKGIYAYGSDRGSYLRRQNIAITRWSYLHVAFRQEAGESVAIDINFSYLEPIPSKGSDKPEWNLGRIWAISQRLESTNNASFIWLYRRSLYMLTIMSSPYMTIPSLKYKISRILVRALVSHEVFFNCVPRLFQFHPR